MILFVSLLLKKDSFAFLNMPSAVPQTRETGLVVLIGNHKKMPPLAREHLPAKSKGAFPASGETLTFVCVGIVGLIWELGFCALRGGFPGSL